MIKLLLTLLTLALGAEYLVQYSYYDFGDTTCTGSWQRISARPVGCSPSNGYGAPYGYIDYNSTFASHYNCFDPDCQNCTLYEELAPLNLSCQYSPFPPYHTLSRVTSSFPIIPEGWPAIFFYSGDECQEGQLSFFFAQDSICRGGPQLPAAFGASCSSGSYTSLQCSSEGSCDRENCTVNYVYPTNECLSGTKYICPAASSPTPGWIITRHFANQDSCTGTPAGISAASTSCNPRNGFPYGYVTFNEDVAVYYTCSDPNCENCTKGATSTLTFGCQVVQGTYPRGTLTSAARNLPTLAEGTSSIYYYSRAGCQDADLYEIYNADSVCRFRPHSLYSDATTCNSTAVTYLSNCGGSMCDETHCSSITSTRTGECLPAGNGSAKYVCHIADVTSAPQQSTSQPLGCEQDWQCSSAGTTYGFAECQSGVCRCRESFQGSAIQNDQCRCDHRTVYDQSGKPNCVPAGKCAVGGQALPYLCSEYTENYQFIECDNGTCKCKAGFDGNATAESKCRCNKNLSWLGSEPSCR